VEAWVAFHTGDWASARRLVDAVLPETRRRGDPWAEAIMLNLDASLELWSGQAQRAVDIAQHARAVAERVDDATLGVEARAIEGRALVSLGRIDEGTDMLESSYALAEQADDRESRRVAVITNCASAARLGEPERAIRWAARYEGMHDDPAVVGEADLMVSLALAMLQRGAVDEAASQLSWVEDAGSEHVEHFADAVGAMLAAAMGATERCEQLTAKTLAGRSTYLDRVFALLARAAARTQTNDLDGCDEALAAARAELEPTDDQPARRLVELVAAVCGRSSLADAEDRMRSSGLDPSGWERAWALAVRPTAEPAPD
jgi:hypothetical protein